MGIVADDVALVRASVNIADVVGQYTQLRRVGLRLVGLCPFHAEKTPSFSVNPQLGLYHCFGCRVGGDVIKFLREKEGLDFQTAVERLAAKAGIALRYTTTNESEERLRRGRLIEAVGKAVAFYHARLLQSADAGEARKYLRSRGYGGDVAREYSIGWAPGAWDELARHLRLPDKEWVDSGLGYINSRGRQTDFFRSRLLFPIFDERGDPVGFGGRILPGHEGAKYKNTSDTAIIYSKSRVLYGLNWAKASAVTKGEVIVCEGYTDVIGFALAGVPNAVATCGTALTEDHVRLLQRFARRIVLAFDADAAGQGATDRAYEWESKFDVEFAVCALPEGVDPADLARRDPAALAEAVTGARPLLGYRVHRVLASGDLRSPEGRGRTAVAALAVVRQHPSDLVRDQYLMQVADTCHIDINTLRAQLRNQSRGIAVRVVRPVAGDDPSAITAEDVALAALLQRRDEVAPHLSAALFSHPLRRDAYEAVVAHDDLHSAIAASDAAVGELLYRVAVEEPVDDVMSVVADLAHHGARRCLHSLRADAAHARTLVEAKQYAPVIDWLLHRIAELDSAEGRESSANQLVAWLGEHAEEMAHGG